jgi:hypothetical protein
VTKLKETKNEIRCFAFCPASKHECKVKWDEKCDEIYTIKPPLFDKPIYVPWTGYFTGVPPSNNLKSSNIISPPPLVEVPAGTKFEFCTYKVELASKRGDTEWLVTHARPDSIGIRLRAWGSANVFDRWGSQIEILLNSVKIISIPNTQEQRKAAGCTDDWHTVDSSGSNTEISCVPIPNGGGLGTQICKDRKWEDGRWVGGIPYHCGTCQTTDF